MIGLTVITMVVVFMVSAYMILKALSGFKAILARDEEGGAMDDILNNMVVKLQDTKLTPAEEHKYKISDDISRDVGDPGAIQELEATPYSHRKWRTNQEKEFKKARLAVLI